MPGDNSPNSPLHSFDVLNYKINLDIRSCFLSPYPKSFTGSVLITFRADSVINYINLHAVNTSITVNSVSNAGISFTHTNNILRINLNRTYSIGETAQVLIKYQHLNVTDNAFYTGNGWVFTDSEPEGARKWFPCWDKPSDKATVELTAKVPVNVRLGSNGRLIDSTQSGDSLFYHWKSRDPIATYLIVISAKVNYKLDIINWTEPGSNITYPIRFYYSQGEYPDYIKSIIGNMSTFFSGKFGYYPFEKNGFATLSEQFGMGGMENQTLTSLCSGCWSELVVSHELAHQWFGDMVTCGTWADIWLNEGFATYSEALWKEHTEGYQAYKTEILSYAYNYFSGNTGRPVYVQDWAVNTPPSSEMFFYPMTYAKSACILHMLRFVLGDAGFFHVIREYATDTAGFKYKTAITDDFAVKISEAANTNMVWFVEQWIKQPNHPIYANIYQFAGLGGGNWSVSFQAKQTQTGTPFHRMPVVVKISFTSGPDTNIRVDNNTNNQVWTWVFSRQPNSLVFDPNNDIVLKLGTTSPGTITGISANQNEIPGRFSLYQNYPNPFNPDTKIRFDIPAKSLVELKVYDAAGKLVNTLYSGQIESGKYTADFNALNIASGLYYYELTAVNETRGNFRDVKKMVLLK